MELANLPEPPYYAVIFNSIMEEEVDGYHETADKILELAQQQPGFLGFESARSDIGMTISYWQDLESIAKWKANAEHLEVQHNGKNSWYKSYRVRIAKVERAYGFDK